MTSKNDDTILRVPPKGKPTDKNQAARLLQFVKEFQNQQNLQRREKEVEWLECDADLKGYFWRKRVWDQKNPRVTPRLVVDETDKGKIPLPEINLLLKVHENETARLSKRQSKFKVEPSDVSDPGKRAAAKRGTEILRFLTEDRTDGVGWKYQHRLYWHRFLQYGTSFLKAWTLHDNLDTTRIGVKTAVKCAGHPATKDTQIVPDPLTGLPVPQEVEVPARPGCGCRLADTKLSDKHVNEHYPQWAEQPGMFIANSPFMVESGFSDRDQAVEQKVRNKYTAMRCPGCDGDLEPFMPIKQEIHEKDSVGRDLGRDVPLAKVLIESPSVFEMYVENEGVGVGPHNCTKWSQVSARPMNWVKRYFQVNTDGLRPDDPMEIAELFPMLNEYTDSTKWRSGSGVSDRNVYADMVILREYYEDRSPDHPMGRAIVMAGTTCLMDEDLYVQPEDKNLKPFPRVKYGAGRCFLRDNDFYGDGFCRHGRSIVKMILMAKSQQVDRRQRNIVGILTTAGQALKRAWRTAVNAQVLEYEPDHRFLDKPDLAKPQPFQTGAPDTTINEEIREGERMLQEVLGVNEADIGELKNLASTPYSLYKLAKDSSGERRVPRLWEGVEAITIVMEAALCQVREFYIEPRKYRIEAPDGWEQKEFTGSMIGGETGVVVEEEADFDEESAQRDALNAVLPQLQFSSRREQLKAYEMLGVNKDVLASTSVQLESAERKWMEWLRRGKVPIIDPALDDIELFSQEFRHFLVSDDGVEWSDKAQWPEVLDLVAGWEEELAKLQQAIPALKQMGWKNGQPIIQQQPAPVDEFGNELGPPQMVNLLDQVAQAQYQQQVAMAAQADADYQTQVAMAQQQGIDPATIPQPQPPQEPTPSEVQNTAPLKEGLQHLILFTWQDLLLRSGVQADPEVEEARAMYLPIRAYWQALDMMAKNLAQEQAAQMPVAA